MATASLEVAVHLDQVQDSDIVVATDSDEIVHKVLHGLFLVLLLDPIIPLLRYDVFVINILVLFLQPEWH